MKKHAEQHGAHYQRAKNRAADVCAVVWFLVNLCKKLRTVTVTCWAPAPNGGEMIVEVVEIDEAQVERFSAVDFRKNYRISVVRGCLISEGR